MRGLSRGPGSMRWEMALPFLPPQDRRVCLGLAPVSYGPGAASGRVVGCRKARVRGFLGIAGPASAGYGAQWSTLEAGFWGGYNRRRDGSVARAASVLSVRTRRRDPDTPPGSGVKGRWLHRRGGLRRRYRSRRRWLVRRGRTACRVVGWGDRSASFSWRVGRVVGGRPYCDLPVSRLPSLYGKLRPGLLPAVFQNLLGAPGTLPHSSAQVSAPLCVSIA